MPPRRAFFEKCRESFIFQICNIPILQWWCVAAVRLCLYVHVYSILFGLMEFIRIIIVAAILFIVSVVLFRYRILRIEFDFSNYFTRDNLLVNKMCLRVLCVRARVFLLRVIGSKNFCLFSSFSSRSGVYSTYIIVCTNSAYSRRRHTYVAVYLGHTRVFFIPEPKGSLPVLIV